MPRAAGPGWLEVARMRPAALGEVSAPAVTADAWYEAATRLIDALKTIEDALNTDAAQDGRAD